MGAEFVPFVFRDADQLPKPKPSDRSRSYDPKRQLWIDKDTGEPWVLHLARLQQGARSPTRYGETLVTQTTEGIDKSESVQATQFGETTVTRTSERVDKSEAIGATEFGETTITKTSEAPDQPEGVGGFRGSPYRMIS